MSLPPLGHQGVIDDAPQKPRREGAAYIELVNTLVHPQESRLHDVFGQGGILGDEIRHAHRLNIVLPYKRLQTTDIAPPQLINGFPLRHDTAPKVPNLPNAFRIYYEQVREKVQ